MFIFHCCFQSLSFFFVLFAFHQHMLHWLHYPTLFTFSIQMYTHFLQCPIQPSLSNPQPCCAHLFSPWFEKRDTHSVVIIPFIDKIMILTIPLHLSSSSSSIVKIVTTGFFVLFFLILKAINWPSKSVSKSSEHPLSHFVLVIQLWNSLWFDWNHLTPWEEL